MHERHEAGAHELDDVDSEMLVDHRAEPDARAAEEGHEVPKGRVDDELEAGGRDAQRVCREGAQGLDARRVAGVPDAACENELDARRRVRTVQIRFKCAELGGVLFLGSDV